MTLFAANAGDWISVIIPIVVTIIWILNQVIGRLGQPQNPPRDVRRPAAAPPPPRPQQAKVDEEIEAFLRRASEQRGQVQRPSPPQPAPPRTLVPKPDAIASSRRPPAESLVRVEMVDESEEGPADTRSVSVSEHVQRHLDTRDFQQRAAAITKVDQADEQLEQRLHDAFDHQVGTLTSRQEAQQKAAAAAATASRVTAGGVLAMLRDPNSLRNAIILQEILRRPEER